MIYLQRTRKMIHILQYTPLGSPQLHSSILLIEKKSVSIWKKTNQSQYQEMGVLGNIINKELFFLEIGDFFSFETAFEVDRMFTGQVEGLSTTIGHILLHGLIKKRQQREADSQTTLD